MIFQNLRISNFGVFRGQHQFDLAPISRPNDIRHLTVISGHNGSGKSTLFQALAIALHGSLTLGNKVSRQNYSDFLASRLHRHGTGDGLKTSNEAGVEVNFQYVQYGKPSHIHVKRHWHRGSSNVTESLSILQDGHPPDVEPNDYQIWLNDLISPGLLPLCFFDAEQLSALANPEDHDGSLREIFHRLLGIDLVERLQADLGYYTRQHGGGGPGTDQLATVVAEQQAAVDKLDAQLHELHIEAEKLNAKRNGFESELEKQELKLASEGGAYATQRPIWQERLTTVQPEVELISNQLRDLCAGLLPFTLAPDLCRILSKRLTQEAELHRRQIAGDLWREKTSKFETTLLDDDFWRGIDLSSDIRQNLVEKLIHTIQEAENSDASVEKPLIHQIAEAEHEQLQEWITKVLCSIPQQARELSEKLRQLQDEKERIADDLKKAPDDDALLPIRNEISELESSIEALDQQNTLLDKKIESIQLQLDEKQRLLQRVIDDLKTAQITERKLALTERSKLVLRTYKDAMTRQRLGVLEEALLTAFNTLCRKEHLLETIRIDPDDFHTLLLGVSDNGLDLESFSAGERQLYAMALLWALRQISGRQLPLVVDTPLARMDEVHRSRLLLRYFPSVSDQVVLFSTGTELDAGMLAQVEPHLARSYQLNYDAHRGETIVTCNNEPIPRGIVLYRGTEPSSIDSDIYGNYGQFWTHDPERFNGRDVKRVLLSVGAKRLVLFDPVNAKYDWPNIAELERIANNASIAGKLRNGHQINDIWDKQWTCDLMKLDYESIATVGADGAEEYVLNLDMLIPLDEATP